MGRRMLGAQDPAGVTQALLDDLLSATGAAQAAVYLRQGERLVPFCLRGLPDMPLPVEEAVPRMETALREVGSSLMAQGEAFSWPELLPARAGYGEPARICVPTHVMGKLNGVILLGISQRGRGFTRGDVELLWIIGDRLGLVIEYMLEPGEGPAQT